MYQSNRNLNILPPGIPRAFGILCCPGGREFDELSLSRDGAFDHYSKGGWGIWSLASISCYVTLIPRGVINHGGSKPCRIQSERYRFMADGWKAKACASFALNLKVFKNHLNYLRHVRVLSIKPCLHLQLLEHNKSYRKVSRGGGIWSPGMDLWWGIWTAFQPREGGNLNNNFPKIQMPGGDV